MALEDYRETMVTCTRCSYCKWIPFAHVKSLRFAQGCPSIGYKNFHTYSAGGRLSAALSLLEGRVSHSKELQEVVYQCLLCGNCDVTCKLCRYNMEPLGAFRELRAKMVEDGQVIPQHERLIDNLSKEANMVMKPNADRGEWAAGLGLKNLTREKAQVVFHAGCELSYDEELMKIARTAVTILKNVGVDVGIMQNEEHCCGGRAYDLGYRADFRRSAEHNIKSWTDAGVKTVVTSCPHCYYAFERLYPQIGSRFEVFHIVEYLDRLIKEGKIKLTKSVPMTVTYHDPCFLGRQGEKYVPWNGITKKVFGQIPVHDPPAPRYNGARGGYEPPRDILKAIPGLELIEMERIREYAWCCGAGGGVREAYPELSSWTARERIEEAKTTGAEAIVSACPWCERTFIDAIDGDAQQMKVYDIIELVQQAI